MWFSNLVKFVRWLPSTNVSVESFCGDTNLAFSLFRRVLLRFFGFHLINLLIIVVQLKKHVCRWHVRCGVCNKNWYINHAINTWSAFFLLNMTYVSDFIFNFCVSIFQIFLHHEINYSLPDRSPRRFIIYNSNDFCKHNFNGIG